MKTFTIFVPLLAFGAVMLFSLCSRLQQPMTAEQSQLIEDFRNQRFSSLDAIHPRPTIILGRNDLYNPDQYVAHVLHYDYEDNTRLVIVLNNQLRLISYSVERQD